MRHQPNHAELRLFTLAAFYAGWPSRVKHRRGSADVEARMRRWLAGTQPELRELRQALMDGIEERRKLLAEVKQLEGEINQALSSMYSVVRRLDGSFCQEVWKLPSGNGLHQALITSAV